MNRIFTLKSTRRMRIVAFLIAVVMLLSSLPFGTAASESSESAETVSVPQKPEGNKDYADYMTVSTSKLQDTDLTYSNGILTSTADRTPVATFQGLPFSVSDTYVLGFQLTTKVAEKNFHSARVTLGTTQDGDTEKALRMYFMGDCIQLFNGNDCIWGTTFDRKLGQEYRVDMLIEANAVSLWVDNTYLGKKDNLPDKVATTTKIQFENAAAVITDMDLYYTKMEDFSNDPKLPEQPAGNKNYADYMTIGSSNYYTFTGGILESQSEKSAASTTFGNLPFQAEDTYVYGFNLTTEAAEKNWQGARIILGKITDGETEKTLRMYFMADSIGLYKNDDCIWSMGFNRNFGETYRVDMLVEPTAISLWINDVYMTKVSNLPAKTSVVTGVLFENAKATMSDFDLYYTTEESFPVIPEKPAVNKNYADYMTVGISQAQNGDCTYKDGTLSSTTEERTPSATFGNLPFTTEDSYVYGFNLTTKKAASNPKSARITLGTIKEGEQEKVLRMFFLGESIGLYKGGDCIWETRFNRNLGETYRIDMLVEPTAISLWINGAYVDKISIPTRTTVVTGVLFENAKVTMSDFDLYYTTEESFPVIPEKPAVNKNYADYMTVGISQAQDGDCTYKDGTLSSTTEERTPSATFGNLPFTTEDSYVYGFNLTTKKAASNPKSARITLGTIKEGEQEKVLRMFFLGESIGLYKGGDCIWETRFNRNLGETYRIDMLVEPTAISLWINGTYMDKISIPTRTSVVTGVLFENAEVTMSDFDLYCTTKEAYPSIPEKPEGNKNYAEYMTVGINKEQADDCTYADGKLVSATTERTPSATFGNLPFGTDDAYVFGFKLTTEVAEKNWHSARMILGKVKDGETEKILRMYFMQDSIGLYKGDDAIWQMTFKREIGKTYRVDFFVEANAITVWIDGQYMDTIENIPVKTAVTTGVLFEKAKASITDFDLYYITEEVFPSIPTKPEGNANYAEYMKISRNESVYTYKDGKLSFLSDANAGQVIFKELPFTATETYVYGFDLKTEAAEKNWKSARILLGRIQDGDTEKNLMMYFLGDSIGLYKGTDSIWQIPFERKLGTTYRVDMLIEPNAVSLWIDGTYIDTISGLPNKTEAKTGVQFEYAKAVMSNIALYYTGKVPFTPPEKLVYKEIADGQYNAADWMSVTLKGQAYNGYFGNKLTSNTTAEASKYKFDNMPITDDMSYYYSATYKTTESDANHKGPRFIFRQDGTTELQVAITKNEVVLLLGGKAINGIQFESKVGQSYNIVMYSTPSKISVWIDGTLLFEEFDLTPYVSATPLSAKMGVLFEYCKGTVSNLAIYGDKIVFNSNYVDPVLYYDRYYTMDGVPAMKGLNLFQNITMRELSNGASGAKFNKETSVLETEYNNGKGSLEFVDANGSSNLNGLRNHSGYVYSFTYEVTDWEAENEGQSEFWVRTNKSAGEWTTKLNGISLGFSGTALQLQVYEEGELLSSQVVAFTRKNDTKYDVAIVHGEKWIKLYIDDELRMVSTQLPSYDVDFNFSLNNMKVKFTDFKLYEFEDSGLSICETVQKKEAVDPGNTIINAAEYSSFAEIPLPVVIIAVCSGIAFLAVLGIVIAVVYNAKQRKKETEVGGEKI